LHPINGIIFWLGFEYLDFGVVMIKLRKDTVFEDPQERICEYCSIEIYHGYDDKHSINNVLTKEDIDAANNLYAMIDRYDNTESARLLSMHAHAFSYP